MGESVTLHFPRHFAGTLPLPCVGFSLLILKYDCSGQAGNLPPASLPPPTLAVFHKEERSKERRRSRKECHLLIHLHPCFNWPAQVIWLHKLETSTICWLFTFLWDIVKSQDQSMKDNPLQKDQQQANPPLLSRQFK